LITKTLPGELFIIRNIANIIPPYRIREEYLSTTSAIEYAVKRLNIKAVIVCGHSNCGGCAALYQPPEELADIPNVQKWLELFEEIPEKVKEKLGSLDDPAAREWLTEQMNVVKQMKHLMTYPFIREKYKKREIQIYGWHYIIETGEIFQYDPDKNCFELISPGEEKS
jgi:carbonic anhydrase